MIVDSTDRDLGKSSTADLQAAYGDNGLEAFYGATAAEACDTFQDGVLLPFLDSEGDGSLGTGANGQFPLGVDLTFGLKTDVSDNQPPVITRTSAAGNDLTGEFGAPAGGFIPNIASPSDGTTNASGMPAAPEGYAANLPSSGMGSLQYPANIEMAADNALVGTDLALGKRPGRTGDDESAGI